MICGTLPQDLFLCCKGFFQLLAAMYDCMSEELDHRYHPEKIKVGSQEWFQYSEKFRHLRS